MKEKVIFLTKGEVKNGTPMALLKKILNLLALSKIYDFSIIQ